MGPLTWIQYRFPCLLELAAFMSIEHNETLSFAIKDGGPVFLLILLERHGSVTSQTQASFLIISIELGLRTSEFSVVP